MLKKILQSWLCKSEIDIQQISHLVESQNSIIDRHVLITRSDTKGKITYISEAFSKLSGYTSEDLIGKSHAILGHNSEQKHLIKELWSTITQNKIWEGELENFKKNRESLWVKVVIEPMFDIHNTKIGYSVIREDITEKKRLELEADTDALTRLGSKKRFTIMFQDEFRKTKLLNRYFALLLISIDDFAAYKEYYGEESAQETLQEIGTRIFEHTDHLGEHAFRLGENEFAIIFVGLNDQEIAEHIKNLKYAIYALGKLNTKSKVDEMLTISIGALNVINTEATKDEIMFEASDLLYKAQNEGGDKVLFQRSISDATISKSVDKVTRLPDRFELGKQLSNLQNEAMLAIIAYDSLPQYFNHYQDTFVDELIIEKAKSLRRIIVDESATLYRLNAQEFVLLCLDSSMFDVYISLLEYSVLAENKVEVAGEDFELRPTIGVGYGRAKLLNIANYGLKEAKKDHRGFYVCEKNFNFAEATNGNFDKVKIYKTALENDQIVAFFQPIVDAKTHEIVKYEALARIKTTDGTIYSPYTFLDIAKADKTYEFFTRQIMQKIFKIYAKITAEITLNLTYQNITSPTMVDYLINRLEMYGGERLTIEIVESEDIEDYKVIEAFILRVKSFGCKIAIDDFGSGYSNFTNIIKINTDFLKLDGSLIEGISHDKNVESMVKALISFAKDTGIKTIAEFVSSQEIVDKATELGVDYFQGYYFGKPEEPEFYGLA